MKEKNRLHSDSKSRPAARALNYRLPGINRDQGHPEQMHVCPHTAWPEDDKLPAAWALPHAFAGPIIIAHDLAGAEEYYHHSPLRQKPSNNAIDSVRMQKATLPAAAWYLPIFSCAFCPAPRGKTAHSRKVPLCRRPNPPTG